MATLPQASIQRWETGTSSPRADACLTSAKLLATFADTAGYDATEAPSSR
jgi:hypothetical protein